MGTDFNNDREKFEYQMASKKVVKLKSFYIHTFIYITGLIVYVLKDYYSFPLNFFPFEYLNYITMIIWTCVYLISAVDMFTSYKIFDKEWEERKLKNILDKREKKQKWE